MQTFIFGIEVSVLGMGIVFATLVFLIGVIKVMGMATEKLAEKKQASDSVAARDNVQEQKITPTAEDTSEILAVISAAIACMTQGNGRIVTISRVREEFVPGWAAAGRQETMKLRQEV